jgi:hypothetical protein
MLVTTSMMPEGPGLLVSPGNQGHGRGHAARYVAGVRLAFPDPALGTAGIVLRRPVPGDVPWITAACRDRELSRYIPLIPYPYSESDARAFIEHADRGWAEGSGATFVIAHPAGSGLGTIGLHPFANDAGLAEVGYWLRREARGLYPRGPAPGMDADSRGPTRQRDVFPAARRQEPRAR